MYTTRRVLNGYYRIANCGSGRFLSGISWLKSNKPDISETELPPFTIALQSCREDVSSQVWIVRAAPNDDVNPEFALDIATRGPNSEYRAKELENSASPTPNQVEGLFVIELANSSVRAGGDFPFRLEVRHKSKNDDLAVMPGVPGLLDPEFPLPPMSTSTLEQIHPTIPDDLISSQNAGYDKKSEPPELVAAPKGGPATNFQFISIPEDPGKPASNNEVLIYHPQTKSYLAQINENTFGKNIGVSLIAEAEVRDILREDVNFIQGGNEGPPAYQANPKFLKWKIQSEGFGPRRGDFRLLHSLSLTALSAASPSTTMDGSQNLVLDKPHDLDGLDALIALYGGRATSLAPLTAKNCSSDDLRWTVETHIANGISYKLSNQQNALSIEDYTEASSADPTQGPCFWNFMFVPSTKVAVPEIQGVYLPPPKGDQLTANLHYIIYKEANDFDIFLGLLPATDIEGTSSPALVQLKVPRREDLLDENISGCSNSVARLLREDAAAFWSHYGWLIWRMNVFKKLPPDGIYKISPWLDGTKMLLNISKSYPTSTQLELIDEKIIKTIGTGSWLWNITTLVADNGVVYQYIRNYHTGHNINIYQNAITAFRTGRDSRWKRWHITQINYADSETDGSQLYSWTSHVLHSGYVTLDSDSSASVKLVEGSGGNDSLNKWWELTYVDFTKSIRDIPVRFDILPKFIADRPEDFDKESYLPDGLYKIEHKFTKSNLVADSFASDLFRLTKTIPTEKLTSTQTYARSLWYIQRDLNSTAITDTYIITNMDAVERPMKLQERYNIMLQPYAGVSVAVRTANNHQWRLWKHKTLGYVIQSEGGSGGILGVTMEGKVSTRPLFADTPAPSNYWGFTKLRNDISEGIYTISRSGNHLSYIRSDKIVRETSGRSEVSSTWIIKPTDRGLYTIQNAKSMLYLSQTWEDGIIGVREFNVISEPCINQTEPSEWMLQREENGLLRIRNPLAISAWSVESRNAYSVTRIEQGARLFESRSSDKVAAGIYTITNVENGQRLRFGPTTGLGSLAECKNDPGSFWRIIPSSTGYYSISQNGAYLSVSTKAIDPRSSQPCVGVSGLDLALWKLVITQEGFYKLINKETGLAIAPTYKNDLIQTKDDTASIKDTVWKIEMKEALIDPKDSSYELSVPDGPYLFQNSSSSLVLSCLESGKSISVAKQDSSREDINSKFQALSVRKNRDGWYRISGYAYGTYLSLQTSSGQASLTLKEASMGIEDDTLDWRFVQQASTDLVTLVNQSAPELGFETPVPGGQLKISNFTTGNKAMLWSISPTMGTTKETKFSPGVYLISAYMTREEVAVRLTTTASEPTTTNPLVGAPLALECNSDYGKPAFLNSLSPQNHMQLWSLNEVEGIEHVYSIRSFSLRDGINTGDETIVKWKITAHNTGGFKIKSIAPPGQQRSELLLVHPNKLLKAVEEGGAEENDALWQIGRTGVYLQNQAPTLYNKVLGVGDNDIVQMMNYNLSWMISTEQISRRIWHLVRNTDESFSLLNEATGYPLHPERGMMKAGNMLEVPVPSNYLRWALVKLGEGIAFQFLAVTNMALLLGVSGEAGNTVLLRPGPEEVSRRAETNEIFNVPTSWKTWSMIPVAEVEGKPYMSLPRYLVATKTESPSYWTHVWQESPSGDAKLSSYEPDNAWQRFRMQTLGGYSILIDEATGNLLPNNGGKMANPIATDRHDVWFKVDTESTLIRADGWRRGTVATEKSRLVSHPGDFFKFGSDFRLQIQPRRDETYVLSLNEDLNLTMAELDMSDDNQLWNNWDMGLGRRIFHSKTRKLLERTDDGIAIVRDWTPDQKNVTFWDFSTDHGNEISGANGYHILKVFNSSDGLALRAYPSDRPVRLSDSPTPIRMVRRSKWIALSRRLLVLQRFVQMRAPILVHAKGVKSPYNVKEHLSQHILYNLEGTVIDTNPNPNSLPTEVGRYKLLPKMSDTDPVGTSVKAYVSICQATDPIHLNYTDFNLFILYPPESRSSSRKPDYGGGWKRLTLRINNETNLLESVYFPKPGPGWVFNLDMNFAATKDPSGNPLKIYRVPETNVIRLHIFVDGEGNLTPYFPKDTTMVDILDKTKWGPCCDIGADAEIIKAPFVDDDGTGLVPKMPAWTGYQGQWTREPMSKCSEEEFWNVSADGG